MKCSTALIRKFLVFDLASECNPNRLLYREGKSYNHYTFTNKQ